MTPSTKDPLAEPFAKATPRPWVQFLDRDAQTVEFLPTEHPGTTGVTVSIATDEGNANAFLIDAAIRAYGQPTEFERELTAALRLARKTIDLASTRAWGRTEKDHLDAILTKATERGL